MKTIDYIGTDVSKKTLQIDVAKEFTFAKTLVKWHEVLV